MSKGLGKIERQALEIITTTEKVLWPSEIAAKIFGIDLPKYPKRGEFIFPEAKIVSVRRALRNLARQGLIESMGPRWRGGQIGYANPTYAEQSRLREKMTFGR